MTKKDLQCISFLSAASTERVRLSLTTTQRGLVYEKDDNRMAPLPPNSTNRYWVDYRANGREHTAMFRYAAGGSVEPDAVFIARCASFLADVQLYLPNDFSVLGARYAVAGSDISLPATAPGSPTGAGAPKQGEAPAFLTFVGRTATGRRARIFLLGVAASAADEGTFINDYRITASESAVITAAVANLGGWPGLVGIDGNPIVFYGYANAGYNAHWQREMRN